MKENTKQRSHFVLIAMILLLALVLAMGGTTLAKYVTDRTYSASATVAKWGYVVSAQNTLFGQRYDSTGSIDNATGLSVVSSSNTVAPGTNGAVQLSVNGKAEVLSKLSFSTTGSSAITLTKNATGNDIDTDAVEPGNQPYEPMVWSIHGTAFTLKDSVETPLHGSDKNINVSGLTMAEMNEIIENLSLASIDAGTTVDISLTVAWSWAEEIDDTTNGYDTLLGYISEGTPAVAAEIGAAEGTTTVTVRIHALIEQIMA